jgi:hypothetical protein
MLLELESRGKDSKHKELKLNKNLLLKVVFILHQPTHNTENLKDQKLIFYDKKIH